MSFLDPQNPGLGYAAELTASELSLVQSISALGDPGADRILFWDESSNAYDFLTVSGGIGITGTTLSVEGGIMVSTIADGASAIAFTLTSPAYSTAGAKLLSLKNNTNEYLSVSYLGYITQRTSTATTFYSVLGTTDEASIFSIANVNSVANPVLRITGGGTVQLYGGAGATLSLGIGTTATVSLNSVVGRSIARWQVTQGIDVASANNLTLGADGNVFEITGTTQINLIANTNWSNGAEITLMFTSTPTVKQAQTTSGANITILLAGAVDFVASADDVLTLMLGEIGGVQAWREKCRSVN